MAYIVVYSRGRETHRAELGAAVTLGRSLSCDIRLDDPAASREHCRISADGDGWVVVDLESRNGTIVGGRIAGEMKLRQGDVVMAGGSEIHFHDGPFRPARASDPARDQIARLMDTRRVEKAERNGARINQPRPLVAKKARGNAVEDTQAPARDNSLAFRRPTAKPAVKGF